MSSTSKHHHELTDGKGKCSCPMWMGGLPAGFCDRDAFGEYIDGERYPRAPHIGRSVRGQRMDGKYDGYVPGLACPIHGGPTEPSPQLTEG